MILYMVYKDNKQIQPAEGDQAQAESDDKQETGIEIEVVVVVDHNDKEDGVVAVVQSS